MLLLRNYEQLFFIAAHRVLIQVFTQVSLFSGWAAQPNLVTVRRELERTLLVICVHLTAWWSRAERCRCACGSSDQHCDLSDEDWTRLQGRTGRMTDDALVAASPVLCNVAF